MKRCRACGNDSGYCSPEDGFCMYCYRRFKDWAMNTLGLEIRRLSLFEKGRLVATIDVTRPDVVVAIDQWLEKGRP